MVSHRLTKIRDTWAKPDSKASVSLLLTITNQILDKAAAETNKFISLGTSPQVRPVKIPSEILEAKKNLKRIHTLYKTVSSFDRPNVKQKLNTARKYYRFLVRRQNHKEDLVRDSHLFSIFSSNPAPLYKTIRSAKAANNRKIPFLSVGSKIYPGDRAADGMFDSISSLKSQDISSLKASPCYDDWCQDYNYIMELCRDKYDVPNISIEKSTEILKRMKPAVSDFWSITPLHFINAGQEGFLHFNFIMNRIINDINSSSVTELNTAYALFLHKGHGKERTSDRSYRTISTCPVVAKGLDMFLHDLFMDDWNEAEASTQYQGQGSSHDLAALLITEAVQHSIFQLKKPIFLLFLDARSAFDTVVNTFLVRNLYFTGMQGNSLLYMANRLNNRVTYCEWNKELLGPINDEHGLEQGGCNSSDCYKIYNNELLDIAQASRQGVVMGKDLVISSVGQADDVALLSNSIYGLFNVLHLVLNNCKRYNIKLCRDKTKLLLITRDPDEEYIPFNPISIDEQTVDFSSEAEHVGVTRSCDGNMPNLLKRISAHRKALHASLAAGASRGHRANIAATLKLEKIYAMPVLFSGLASLVLNNYEVNCVDHHYTNILQQLLKLHTGTPRAVVYFLSGSLPAKAILHVKQLGLFSMISHLPDDPLFLHARSVLTTHPPTSKSWFVQIRSLCLMYGLPHPLGQLESPLPKPEFKKLVRSLVLDHWEQHLRQEVSHLPSLRYFHPEYHSLAHPHPILWTAGANPHEVTKAVVQTKMLSGRYRVASLTRHFGPDKSGSCPAPCCPSTEIETLEHLLVSCPYYRPTREKITRLWTSTEHPSVSVLLLSMLAGPTPALVQFLLDPSINPLVISMTDKHGKGPLLVLFHMTRSWCYSIHIQRTKLLKKFNF